MKKILFLFAVLLSTVRASAEEFKVGRIYYNILSVLDRTCEVISGDYKYTFDVVIPASVTYNGGTFSVTRIGNEAFYNCYDLTSVEIPNSVETIGSSAFAGCKSLTSVEIPNSVTTIGTGAFEDCKSLTSVEIPNSVKTIGDYAFDGCSSLTTVEIGNSVKTIGEWAFYWCKSLTSVVIGNSVTEIGYEAFRYCSSLTSVVIPNSVTEIGNGAFADCSGLTSVEIGSSVTTIGEDAFYKCSSLISVVIGNSVKTIGDWAFNECASLKEIISLNTTPPTVNWELFYSNSFYGVSKSDCVVKVPAEAVDAYKTAKGWKEFYNIVAIDGDEPGETEYPQFAPDKLYTLGTARGYLPNSAALTDLWGSGYILSTEDEDEAGLFRIIGDNGEYQLLNTSIGKYLSANGTPTTAYVDEPDGTFAIIQATKHGGSEGKWIIKSNETGKWMMFGGGNQFLNNDGWKTADDGDQWIIEELEPTYFTPDPDKFYTLATPRGYLPQGEELTLIAGSDHIVSVESADEAGRFRITGSAGECAIYNVGLKKYLSANGTPQTPYTDAPDGTFTILSARYLGGDSDKWIIKSNETGKWLMFGGSKQFLNNDGWKTADDGDQWTIEEASDVTVLIESVNGSESTIAPMYNIFGQRVGDGYRGIIIRGGRKILQK